MYDTRSPSPSDSSDTPRRARDAWHQWRSLVLVVSATALAACADSSAPSPANQPTPQVVASVEYVGSRAALFLDTGATTRSRVSFTGAPDPIVGNSPLVPPLTDANLLALGPLAWSPSGTRLAMVATVAFDQSEVVVTNADGSAPRVASVNSQIILSQPDWSPDETRLAYAMSTRAQARGVDLFVTHLGTNTVQRLTTGLEYAQSAGALRFSSDGRSVFYAKPTGETGAPLFNKISDVWRVDVATGEQVRLAQGVSGAVQAIARSGAWALVLRQTGINASGEYERALVRVALLGAAPDLVLLPSGRLQYARLTNDDRRAIFARNESTTVGGIANVLRAISTAGGSETAVRGTSEKTITADVFFRP